MTKRQRVNEIEDWGRIIDQVYDILLSDDRTIPDKLKICDKMKRRMAYYWLKSSDEFEIIWRMRWERLERFKDGLKMALDIDVMSCPL